VVCYLLEDLVSIFNTNLGLRGSVSMASLISDKNSTPSKSTVTSGQPLSALKSQTLTKDQIEDSGRTSGSSRTYQRSVSTLHICLFYWSICYMKGIINEKASYVICPYIHQDVHQLTCQLISLSGCHGCQSVCFLQCQTAISACFHLY